MGYDNVAYCTTLFTATYKAGIYDWAADMRPISRMMDPSPPPIFVIPGMKVGCMPYDAMIDSTLECFFSQSCLNTTARWISNLPPEQWPEALNSSKMSAFNSNTPISSLLAQHTVDRWINSTDFAGYYRSCAPSQCTYTVVQYNSFAYVISLLIGMYGGLTVALRFMAPFIVKFGLSIRKYFQARKQARQGIDTDHFVASSANLCDRCSSYRVRGYHEPFRFN